MSLTRTRTLSYRPLLAAGAAATLTLMSGVIGLGLPHAQAHDSVIGGNPAPDAIVEEFPDTIELEFSGIPQESFNTVAVSDTDSGEVLFSGEPTVEDQMVVLPVPEDVTPGAGSYTVGFQITSSDGHATRGSIAFEVAGEATDEAAAETASAEVTDTPTTAEPDETTSPEDQLLSGPLGWVFGGVGVVLVIGVLIMMITKNRNQP
ncbi:copper resistance CopC family protein [Corynebacterium sp. A21]|uniref:copper resistance CopC family protein n=1 Tax=Corynebacterium sp. A21 TaxID=3457318 RepID=UPI003FD20E82